MLGSTVGYEVEVLPIDVLPVDVLLDRAAGCLEDGFGFGSFCLESATNLLQASSIYAR